ncbi:hypothetical protein LOK49_LG02G00896 [Camellia lanceoleosa]|uniref:Uncharacterized protein n=1 Tax=Camellia lanceoleosa TaxID=1840588 RepID=A0ACC0ILY7_9ERIC|nr:hypothetical protein LOK49_LG02G00896 [Camellia lanceoleosa]
MFSFHFPFFLIDSPIGSNGIVRMICIYDNLVITINIIHCIAQFKYESLSTGGITSGWFCLESTLLAFVISGTAFSFYPNRATKNARRMFHASLLYLPVFMSGMLLHRLPDNPQLLGEENSEGITKQLSSSETLVQEIEIANCEKKAKRSGVRAQAQPPIAYASVAPFPFLPAPTYAMP